MGLVMLRHIFLTFSLLSLAQESSPRSAQIISSKNPKRFLSRWMDHSPRPTTNIELLFHYLQQSPIGAKLLIKAQEKAYELGEELYQLIVPNRSSLTNTTLLRRFSRSSPTETTYSFRFKIHINQDLSVIDAVLDLAHELTHFTERETFNPYSSEFSASQFVALTIQGGGGEVAAYLTECKILNELFPQEISIRAKCNQIREGDHHYSSHKATKLFYRVGKDYEQIFQALISSGADKKTLELLSPLPPIFISSAHNTPYPLAALQEYFSIVEKACTNDQKRLQLQEWNTVVKKQYSKRCMNPQKMLVKNILNSKN